MPYGNIRRNLNNEGNMSGILTIQPTAGSGVSDVLVNGTSAVSNHKAYINIDVDQTVTEGQKIASININGQSTDILIPELNVYDEATGDLITIDNAAAAPVNALSVTLEPQQAGTGDPSPDNVRPITGWTECKVIVSPTEDAEDGTTYTINLGGTYYGIRVNADGTGEVTHRYVDLGAFTWTYVNNSIFRANTSTPCKFVSQYQAINAKCEIYKVVAQNSLADSCISCNYSSASESQFYVKDTRFTDATAFKTAVTGKYFCYELATPIPLTLTPTQIDLLRGVNNIWSDGEVYVKWKVDIEMMLQSIIDSRHI